MKQERALWLLGATSVLTLVTVGYLGYRVFGMSQQPSQEQLAEQARLSRQVTPDAAQLGVDALLAMTLPDLEGRPQPLAQWSGKILVINYWATWCPPCIEEMPVFSRLHDRYATAGVQFVGIGMDEAEKMRAFVKQSPVSYPLLVGATSPGDNPAFKLKGMPYTVVLGRDGRVAFSRYGGLDEAALDPVLRQLSAHK